MDKQAVKLDKVFTEAQRQVADLLQEIGAVPWMRSRLLANARRSSRYARF